MQGLPDAEAIAADSNTFTDSQGPADFGSPADSSSLSDSPYFSDASDSGSGSSWTEEPMADRLEGTLKHTWAQAMSLFRAALTPVSFFRQATPQWFQSELAAAWEADADDHTAATQEYWPCTVIETQPWQHAWQQVCKKIQCLVSGARAGADHLGLISTAADTANVEPFSAVAQDITAAAAAAGLSDASKEAAPLIRHKAASVPGSVAAAALGPDFAQVRMGTSQGLGLISSCQQFPCRCIISHI